MANYTRRIFILFLGASFAYFVNSVLARTGPRTPFVAALRTEWTRLFDNPLLLVLQGSVGHLWFLPALIIAVWITVCLRRVARLRTLAAVAVILYMLSLVTGPYRDTPFGLTAVTPLSATLFLGTPFVVMGVLLRYARRLPSRKLSAALLIAGTAIHATEVYWTWFVWGLVPFGHLGPRAGTALQTLAVACLALQPTDSIVSRTLGRLGQFTLMAYLSHIAFLLILRPHHHLFDRSVWHVIFPLSVALLAFAFAAAYAGVSKVLRLRFSHQYRLDDPRLEGV